MVGPLPAKFITVGITTSFVDHCPPLNFLQVKKWPHILGDGLPATVLHLIPHSFDSKEIKAKKNAKRHPCLRIIYIIHIDKLFTELRHSATTQKIRNFFPSHFH